jgi:phosphoglycerate dehydrogenase-like enzyme
VKILLASPIDPSAVESLQRGHVCQQLAKPEPWELRDAVAGSEAVVLRSGVLLSADVLAAAPDLRLVVRAGSGLDNIDVDCARDRGIRVVRIAGMSGPPVAEFTFALLLSLARKVSLADRMLRTGHWPKPELGGPLLHGKVLGVVGAGNIGGLVGQMGSAWGMRVLGCVAHPSTEVAGRLARRGITLADFDQVVANADFVTLHVPLDDSTHHLVDAPVLDQMKPGSLLVNVARGGVVDEKALHEALVNGTSLAGAARRTRDGGRGHGVSARGAAQRGAHPTYRRDGVGLTAAHRRTRGRADRRVSSGKARPGGARWRTRRLSAEARSTGQTRNARDCAPG